MIKLFISVWDGRYDWLQTTADHDVVWRSWAGDHSHLSCAHLSREWQFHAKSHELFGAFLACPPDSAWDPPLLRAERGLPLPGCQTIIHVLRILFSKLSMLLSFQPLSGSSLNSIYAPYCFDWYRFLIRIAFSCKIFMILFNFYQYLDLDIFPK